MFWKEVCIPPSKGKEQGFIQPRAALGASLRKRGSVPACRWDASLPCEGGQGLGCKRGDPGSRSSGAQEAGETERRQVEGGRVGGRR